jgi:hypothetical protein
MRNYLQKRSMMPFPIDLRIIRDHPAGASGGGGGGGTMGTGRGVEMEGEGEGAGAAGEALAEPRRLAWIRSPPLGDDPTRRAEHSSSPLTLRWQCTTVPVHTRRILLKSRLPLVPDFSLVVYHCIWTHPPPPPPQFTHPTRPIPIPCQLLRGRMIIKTGSGTKRVEGQNGFSSASVRHWRRCTCAWRRTARTSRCWRPRCCRTRGPSRRPTSRRPASTTPCGSTTSSALQGGYSDQPLHPR